eukprot:TRINITY_DN17339_c0_g1_i2.p1 TRINITY_DN17339_c0_g1~~TRINITY_DN17339_c0_g1_i2.p1  ORF type:complete len:135 (-),score=3.03 TRINITY_DN17339_c0_g1_i2:161-565(-)
MQKVVSEIVKIQRELHISLRDKVANEQNLKLLNENNEDAALEKKKDLQLKMLCGKLKSQMGIQYSCASRRLEGAAIRLLSGRCAETERLFNREELAHVRARNQTRLLRTLHPPNCTRRSFPQRIPLSCKYYCAR